MHPQRILFAVLPGALVYVHAAICTNNNKGKDMKDRTLMTFAAGKGTCLVLIGILGAQQGPGTGSGPKAAVADLIYSLLIRIQKSSKRN